MAQYDGFTKIPTSELQESDEQVGRDCKVLFIHIMYSSELAIQNNWLHRLRCERWCNVDMCHIYSYPTAN